MTIDRLEKALWQRVEGESRRPVPFGKPEAMHKAVARMRETLRVAGSGRPPRDRIAEALRILYAEGVTVAVAGHARFLCWALLVGETPLLARTDLARELLAALGEQLRRGRLTASGWRGLLEAYFSVPFSRGAVSAWADLRAMLCTSLDMLLEKARFRPTWMQLLDENRGLLGDDPCGRYAQAMMGGDDSALEPLRTILRIPEESWFWKELILAQVAVACERPDAAFVEKVNRLLPAVRQHKALVDDALVLMLTRHAKTLSTQPSEGLKALAVEQWGSPHLLSQARWNLVAPPVKQMVQEWIVREDLRDFFAVLQADGAADERRLQFWLRYAKQIEFAQFALGQYAYESQKLDYVQLRAKRKDRIARLTDQPDALNNAFIIKIKDLLFVEFGQVGNACYIYRLDQCPFNLMDKGFTLWKLKNRKVCLHAFSHNHSWETRLEELLRDYGILPDLDPHYRADSAPRRFSPAAPTARPSSTPVRVSAATSADQVARLKRQVITDYCAKQKLLVLDNTLKGGPFWVLYDKDGTDIARMLKTYGMTYKAGRGWWI